MWIDMLPEDEARWSAEADRLEIILSALVVRAMRQRELAALPSQAARRRFRCERSAGKLSRIFAEVRGDVVELRPPSWDAEVASLEAGW